MSVTVANICKRIRRVVQDEAKSVWDDTDDLLPALNRSRSRIWSKRPEAFFTSKVLSAIPDALTSTTSGDIDVTDAYADAIIAYGSHVLLMEQRREGDREKAAEQLDIYTSIMTGR